MPLSRLLLPLAILALTFAAPRPGQAQDAPITLKVAGGLAGVGQYMQFEAPFWTEQVPLLTGGRVRAEIAPFDRSGIRGQEMMQLMRLGVVPFGTVILGLAAGDEPELNLLDLPVMNPDIATLRQTVALWRPRLQQMLLERYGIELLSVYVYPAQVVFCRRPFAGLGDLVGRRIRVSSVSQSELIEALGATPVVTSFAETVNSVRDGVVECAITGSLSGNQIGLQDVTSHISRQAISWGVSFFGANRAAWAALPEAVRTALATGLGRLQEDIWNAAEQQTEMGYTCNAGLPACQGGKPGRMIVLNDGQQDAARRSQLLRDVVLPGWIRRCGADCAEAWNTFIAPTRGIRARLE